MIHNYSSRLRYSNGLKAKEGGPFFELGPSDRNRSFKTAVKALVALILPSLNELL